MNSAMYPNALPMRWAAPAYLVLLGLALVAFWPGYLGAPKQGMSPWLHIHAISAGLWMFMLIAQPMAIHSGRRELHRLLGRSSPVLMVVIVVSFVGLAHAVMQGKTGLAHAVHAYFLYVRLVLVTTFVGAYVMAWINRRDVAVHSRYMLCTGLSLIDPVVHRLANRMLANPEFNYQLLTFGLVCAILLTLIWLERHAQSGRRVFPIMLAAYIIGGLPLALDFHTWGAPWVMWKSLAASFAALPIP